MRTFRRAVSPVTAAACGLALTAAAMATPASAATAHRGLAATGCTGPFAKVASPSPGSTDNVLGAVAAAGTRHMWAVGRQASGSNYRNLILFNGGRGWSQVVAPDPGPKTDDELTAVSASGPSDAWAAGFYATGNPAKPFAPQALHWDGTSWSAKPLPALPGEFDSDTGPGIVDISPTDAWLVGSYLGPAADVSVIAHWNGTAWSLVSHPAAASTLSAAAASGPGDVWAAGSGPGPSFPAVIEHYNGSKWTTSATLPGIHLSAVTSISPARAWAVGTSGTSGDQTATVRWNGSAWKVVPSPNPSSQNALYGVSAAPGGGVWAVGTEVDFGSGVGEYQPMAMRWDGKAWAAVPATGVAPDIFGSTGSFLGVVAFSASRVVVVGFGSTQADSLVARLCPFRVRDSGFVPASATISAPGAAAYWVIPAADGTSHRLADATGFGLFDSGVKAPGSSYAFAFPASGTWLVRDRSDGATEKVSVPILAAQNPGGRPVLEWASAPPPAGARFKVQDIAPGGTAFSRFKYTTATGTPLGRRLPAGTYRFRSRLRNPATGTATGWSPTLTVTLP